MAQEQTTSYEGATPDEALAKFQEDAAKAGSHGFVPGIASGVSATVAKC